MRGNCKQLNIKRILLVCLLVQSCMFLSLAKVHAQDVTYTDNVSYSVVIPSEVIVDNTSNQAQLPLSITTKSKCNVEIQVDSPSGYKLKSESGNYSLDYKIPDKDKSLVFSNEHSSDGKTQDYSIDISVSGQPVVSGVYTDKLTFDITGKNYTELDPKYKLSFDMNCDDTVYTDYKLLQENESYGVMPTPERDGYRFDGWYTEAAEGEKVTSDTTMGGADATVYAHWTAYTLTINYHNDGADYIKWESGDVNVTGKDVTSYSIETYGQKFSNGVSGLYDAWRWNRTGYAVKRTCWKIGKDGTKEYDDHTAFTNAEDCAAFLDVLEEFKKGNVVVDLYPIWTANSYTVKYVANVTDSSVSGSTASSQHTYDEEKQLTANGFIRDGYVFTGWNTEADGSGTSYDDEAIVKNLTATKNGTVTLYAQWTPISSDNNGKAAGDTE